MTVDRRGLLAIVVGAVALWSVASVVGGRSAAAADQGAAVHLTLAVEGMH